MTYTIAQDIQLVFQASIEEEYQRPADKYLREVAGGTLVSSSNDGNGGWSHSPTDEWEFPDGSFLTVTYSDLYTDW